jgi:hypothetical protein
MIVQHLFQQILFVVDCVIVGLNAVHYSDRSKYLRKCCFKADDVSINGTGCD